MTSPNRSVRGSSKWVMNSRFIALLAIGAMAFSPDLPAQEAHRHFVPVVGHIHGAGEVLWVTDLTLSNRTGEEQTIGLSLLTEGEPFFVVSLDSGDSLVLTELVATLFGVAGAMGLMEVNTLGEEPVDSTVVIRGVDDSGVVASQRVPVYRVSTGPESARLRDLRVDEEFRTNLGLANASSSSVVITLSLRRSGGRAFATTTVVLGPGEHRQQPLQTFFPVLESASAVEVVAEPSGPGAVVYASVLDNETHAARFISAEFGRDP